MLLLSSRCMVHAAERLLANELAYYLNLISRGEDLVASGSANSWHRTAWWWRQAPASSVDRALSLSVAAVPNKGENKRQRTVNRMHINMTSFFK